MYSDLNDGTFTLQEAKGEQPTQGARKPRSKASLHELLDCGVVENMLLRSFVRIFTVGSFFSNVLFVG
jgi:hypothetical protein